VSRVLVTGSAGFIGRHLIKRLAAEGHELTGCDLKDGEDCRDLFRTDESFDLVFHCAATVGGREGIDYNSALLGANNIQLDGALFEWALRTKPGRVVFFSSAASYPIALQAKPLKLHEAHIRFDEIGAPDESYGWAKLTGEMVAQRVRRAGVPVTIVRPFSSYDYDQESCYPFPEFIKRAKRKADPFVVWGDGSQVRDFIHVDDLVEAILILAHKGIDGPVNLGTGVDTSMDELAKLAMRAAGYEAPIEHREDKPVGVRYRVSDNSALLKHYRPRISLEEGVRRALEV
jgi:UDP-glucose 4-epimerase